jgi:hypothetical protein
MRESHTEAAMSTPELIREITHQIGELVRKQIALAKTELRGDLKAELATVIGAAVAAAAALMTLTLLLVTVALALARVMPGWAAGLIVSGFALLITAVAALVAWRKHVRQPLARTRQTLKEDVQWGKALTQHPERAG